MKAKSFLDPLPRVVAHRGDSANFPENTLPAFLSASKMGIDIIETDVHLTKDGELVIWHDDTLERNTNGTGTLESHTLEELKALDAGYTFTQDGGKTFPFRGKGVQLCTLDEALKACPDTRFNIDLKSQEENIAEVFVKIIRENKAENRVCCASFHLNNLKKARTLAPDILTSITTEEVIPRVLFRPFYSNKPSKRKIIFQVPVKQGIFKIITPAFVKKWHKKDAVIMVWTINEEDEMRRLFKLGVDTVMTDNPKLVIKVAKEMGIR